MTREHMYSKLNELAMNQCSASLITEEETEAYLDKIELYDAAEMKSEYDSRFGEDDD